MDDIDFLEYGGARDAGPLVLRVNGELHELADPRRLHFQQVLLALQTGSIPGSPRGIKVWQRGLVLERWRAAWELPDFHGAQRLAYLVDHYRAAISHDLRVAAGLDLGELWRDRRWSLMLDVIDRLPAHSWYAAAVASDEEHARLMAEQIAARQASGEESEPTGPSLTSWTPEVAALTNIYDAVRGVQWAVIAAASEKKPPEPPKPAPRPVTPLERALARAEFNRRREAHKSLVARVLPHKAQS